MTQASPRTMCWTAGAASLLLGVCGQARADQAKPYFAGKTISIVAGSSAGGGYDAYARLVARFLGDHIPGSPRVIVQDMPGGGSLTSVLYLDGTAPKDGTVVTEFNPGVMTQSIVDPAKVKVNFRHIAWVGSVTPDFRICYTWKGTGVKTWQDMAKKHVVTLGATGQSSLSYNDTQMLRTLFHRNVRPILGYPGRSEVHLAIEKGELDGECGSIDGLPVDWLAQRKINIPVKIVDVAMPGVPDSVPYIGKFAKTQEQKRILTVLTAADKLGRPFIVSEKTPPANLAILRKGFDATVEDPQFLAAAKKERLSVSPTTGQEAETVVKELYSVPADLASKAKKYIQ